MTYTIEIITDLRSRLFDEALAEHRHETGNPSAARSAVSLQLVEQRLQTLIMAGIGDPSNTEKKTHPEMARIAAAVMNYDSSAIHDASDQEILTMMKRLAASVLSQA
jgi:hypothetical protein